MRLAIITQRLSWDNFPSKGSWKFSGGVEGNSLLRYISTNERRCQGFERLSADLSAFGKLSIKLKTLLGKTFRLFVNQKVPDLGVIGGKLRYFFSEN
jgi:hypothetical protein